MSTGGSRPQPARFGSALGLLLAAGVPLSLLLVWGHVSTYPDVPPFQTVVTAFHGSALPGAFQIELIALSGVVVAISALAILRPVHPVMLLLCGAAMAAEIILLGFEASSHDVFSSAWRWTDATLVAVFVLSGLGLAVWLGMFVSALTGRKCPDCAERVRRTVIDCPHCGYRFPPPRGFKRCEACQRPVKSEAHVCRYCHHRFGEPVERVSG